MNRLTTVYAEIKIWAGQLKLQVSSNTQQINEEAVGAYPAPTLEFLDSEGTLIARTKPIGAFLIAAHGRFDLVGPYATEAIVYFMQGGPGISTTISGAGVTPTKHTRQIFQGINTEGWYTLIERQPSTAKLLTIDSFKELLARVAGYVS
ncbi:MAG: hypothetical protein G3I10_03510 [Ferrovum sp.]|nr:hypothetical protein [Ferrovum sp.]